MTIGFILPGFKKKIQVIGKGLIFCNSNWIDNKSESFVSLFCDEHLQ